MTSCNTARPFTGRHMAIVMGLFFGVVFAANAMLVIMAKRSWTGLVVQNSYVASQEFNETTRALEASAAMGVSVKELYADDKLTLVLKDSRGAAADVSGLSVKLGRPSYDGEDRVLELDALGGGQYAVKTHLDSGIWVGQVRGKLMGKGLWTRPIRFIVKE